MIHGYDISGYQSSSWTTKTGMLFVKATEGSTFTNSRFVSQFSGAKKYATIHGAYHFARPGGSSVNAQADHFISVVKSHLDTNSLLVLDLEVSKLNQAGTNQFAKNWAARVRSKLPHHRLVLYMGGGYSSNNTGAGLSSHFDLWWYPRYPSTRNTTSWPSSFSPSAPVGRTGWKRPDIWQWADNWGSAHLDANVSDRSVEYLLGGHVSPSTTNWTEVAVKQLPTLRRGTTGEAVQTLQGLLIARSHPEIKVDGNFGATTESAVKAVQHWGKLTADGIVGPKTWPVLLRVA